MDTGEHKRRTICIDIACACAQGLGYFDYILYINIFNMNMSVSEIITKTYN